MTRTRMYAASECTHLDYTNMKKLLSKLRNWHVIILITKYQNSGYTINLQSYQPILLIEFTSHPPPKTQFFFCNKDPKNRRKTKLVLKLSYYRINVLLSHTDRRPY